MKFFSNFQLEYEKLTFEVHHLSHSFLNAIRRLIISDVETLAFRTEYGKESDIKIQTNTSSFHNEFLAHRISLVPIFYDTSKISQYEKDKLEFFIDETNTKTKPIDITTEHIRIRDLSKEPPVEVSDSVRRKFFPPHRLTGDFIPLVTLKPSRTGNSEEGETLQVTMKAAPSSGKEHARYTPTCVSIFTNLRDNEKIKQEIEKRIQEKNLTLQSQNKNPLSEEEKQQLVKSFDLSEADRFFQTDAAGEPNAFLFNIESDGRIPPHIILDKSLFILEDRIHQFLDQMNSDDFLVQKSDQNMLAFDFVFEDEDYTLGYLLEHYLYTLYQNVEDPKIKYVAADVPHPLENKMVIRVALVNSSLHSDYIKELIKESCKEIKKIIHLLQNELKANREFVLDR